MKLFEINTFKKYTRICQANYKIFNIRNSQNATKTRYRLLVGNIRKIAYFFLLLFE